VHTETSFTRFALRQRLPLEEERLISAFGQIRYLRSGAFQYRISHVALSIARAVLGQLGIVV
jgi:hypothetical protein